ncbi:MAG TPA: alpha/beta fold hydrolase [Candidatus Saccharimonadales bacterium]|nr:alpha/beta fold hydrolase [Candidatus Saccharimonadales bacterium]
MWESIIHRWLRVPYTLYVRTNRKGKKPRATVLFLHGIGNTGAAWDDVIAKLPSDIRIISIDLLGFGKSPKPKHLVYSARTQARAVISTLITQAIAGRLIIVGHSLGALVAVEVAKRYPMIIRSLILCSPPFYTSEDDKAPLHRERRLREFYTLVKTHPEQFVKISALAMKYNLSSKSFSVTIDDVDSYIETLESSILNQTALRDAERLKKPMTLIHGRFDPLVIKSNMTKLVEYNNQAELRVVSSGHEVRGRYVSAVVKAINDALQPPA